jgi:hypothetical protein
MGWKPHDGRSAQRRRRRQFGKQTARLIDRASQEREQTRRSLADFEALERRVAALQNPAGGIVDKRRVR